MNQINENENKGFSLVELIVVIAIMAVLTSVLAPSLLGYVEKSRMQKDDSAMGEVTNAIKLALADQDVYDECLFYNVSDNYSCYVDGDKTGDPDPVQKGTKVEDKDRVGTVGTVETGDDWHWDDGARLLDETSYVPDGNMRGMTITFEGSGTNTAVFTLSSAKVNAIPNAPTSRTLHYTASGNAPTSGNTYTLSEMSSSGASGDNKGKLYHKLRAAVGDNITLSSQTYRNSDYTVFIRMGSMGGNEAAKQDAVAVYGQWSGTNLS